MTATTPKRTEPLEAPTRASLEVADIQPRDLDPDDIAAPGAVAVSARQVTERDARFADGVRTLRVGGATVRLEERLLMVVGGVLAPLGIIVVLLGWYGASQTPYVFEQVPYLISGGLLGVGLVFLGAFLYFTHWVTQLVKEHRVQSVAVVEALQRLQDEVSRHGATTAPVPASTNGRSGDVPLVATASGTMAHRPDCIVVAGRSKLRSATEADGLTPCKLCGPY